MRRKKLLTAALCAVLMLASYTISSVTGVSFLEAGETQTVFAAEYEKKENNLASDESVDSVRELGEEGDAESGAAPAAEEAAPTAETPSAPASTEAPPVPETPSAPVSTEAPPAPETPSTPASTEAPPAPETPSTEAPPVSTETPSTQMPTETTPPTETLPSETTPSTETITSETVPGTEQMTGETTPATGQITSATEQLPSETASGTEMQTESETTGTESETEKKTEKETEEETESETSLYGSNEELIAHQNIVIPPDITLEFRFTQVEKCYAIVSDREGAQIYEEKSAEARAVGVLDYYGCCYILKEEDGWYYVESGNVRGFVKAECVVTDEVAQRIVTVKGIQELPEARLLVARTENEAFDYTHTTVQEVMADKVYAVASGEVTIYEQRKNSSREIGTLADGALCYILADETDDWVFVESSDARGFVKKSELITGAAAEDLVAEQGEKNMERAQVLVAPEDNKSCYHTLTSVQAASKEARTREEIVNFAIQFVGNPYVWGGTSLTNGADCSGFVQSVYAHFGYYLPRVAEAQAGYGMQIPVSSAEPGDLIFYARNGYVYHVSMYIGGGRVVQAANKNVGIITSGIAGDAVWATRIITE